MKANMYEYPYKRTGTAYKSRNRKTQRSNKNTAMGEKETAGSNATLTITECS